MKGVIFDCLTQLIKEKYGEEKWTEILLGAGFTRFTVFLPYADVPEEYFGRIFSSVQNSLKKSEIEVSDLFADYWMTVYAPRTYPSFFKDKKGAKEFLLMMDSVHRKVTEDIPYSKPPHFEYQITDENTIQMYYYSSRHLMILFESLVKATAKYFNEQIEIEKLGDTCLVLKFSK
ncbi:MAG: heme NO-binding domain-containing protein [Acidobacteriota bacterium]